MIVRAEYRVETVEQAHFLFFGPGGLSVQWLGGVRPWLVVVEEIQ